MIISDTNIISSFARIHKINLLKITFKEQTIFLTPSVYLELKKAIELGCNFLEETINAIEIKQGFDILTLSKDELFALSQLPASLAAGEKEGLVIYLHRAGNTFLTNDKRARNFCIEKNLSWLDLPSILRLMWKTASCTKREVSKIIEELEEKEGMVFKNKSDIFKN